MDQLDFGLIADPELVPDLDTMLEAILAEADVLARSAGFTAGVSGASSAPKSERERV